MSSANLPSSCANYAPDLDTSNAGVMGSQLLKRLGANVSCDLSSYYAAMAGKASAGPAGMFGNAEFSAQMNGLKKSGCQVLAAVVGNYLNSIYQARCVIENDSTNTVTSVEVSQNAYISAMGPGSSVNCLGGIDISQSASIKCKALSNISSSSADAISDVVKAGMATTAGQIGQIKDGFQGTSSGAKYLQTIQDKLIQSSQDSSVKNAITAVINKYSVNPDGSIKAEFGATVNVSGVCKITQNSLLDLQLANIITNAYMATIASSLTSFLNSKEYQNTSVISSGAPDVVGDMLKNNWMYIVGAIVAVVFGVLLLKFAKSKNASKLIDVATKNPELLSAAFY